MNPAILVREKVSKLVPMLTQRRVSVTQRGSNAFVKYDKSGAPTQVNIPYIPDDADERFLAAVEGFLDHEVAHVMFTDYSVLKKAKLAGVGDLHNCIEDAFIEKKMAQSFQGSSFNLTNVGAFFLANFTDKELAKCTHPSQMVPFLMVPAIRALSGQRVFQDYMEGKWHLIDGAIDKAREYMSLMLPEMTSSADALDVALEVRRLLEHPEEPSAGEGEGGGKGKGRGKGEKSRAGGTSVSDPDEAGDGEGERKERAEGEPGTESEMSSGGAEGVGDAGEGASGEDGSEGSGEVENGASMTTENGSSGGSGSGGGRNVTEVVDLDGGGEAAGEGESDDPKAKPLSWKEFAEALEETSFDEKVAGALSEASAAAARDADYLVYSTDKDIIEPLDTAGMYRADDAVKEMTDSVDHMLGVIQKDLERAVAAKSRAVFTGGHRSGRLHAAALSRLTMFNDERVFRRKQEAHTKDVAVELLVDSSGSMDGQKIRIASYAAYGLSAVLDRMNIANEVLGFTTRGHAGKEIYEEAERVGVTYSRTEPLFVPIIKSFDERMTPETRRRFAALAQASWLANNVDGESVQIASGRLLKRKEKRKILIVLSDGNPSAAGGRDGLRDHLKRTVKAVEATGVEVLALGILDDAPKRYYSKYTLLDNLEKLPTEVMGQVKNLLMKA